MKIYFIGLILLIAIAANARAAKKCFPVTETPTSDIQCPENQSYQCGPPEERCELTCTVREPPICPKSCKLGCFCKHGYVRDKKWNCIPTFECKEKPICKFKHEYFDECGTACPLTCKNPTGAGVVCTEQCVPGCFCEKGYVRNHDGECVKPKDCSKEDPCFLPAEVGPCKGAFTRWAFDVETQTCKLFSYGGCGGNSNNFLTEEECKQTCPVPYTCLQPMVSGPCSNDLQDRWAFNNEIQKCTQFTYGGCGGNDNNFQTEADCTYACPEPNPCFQPTIVGPCRGAIKRWTYNPKSKQCEIFYYGGCAGNSNNFLTEKECESTCEKSPNCFLPIVVGPCKMALERWAYNPKTGKCRKFTYGGCEGNGNNYLTKSDCKKTCEDPDKCTLPITVGACKAMLRRWAFAPSENKCVVFYYGGCGGNGNNFESEIDCQKSCPARQTTSNPCEQSIFPGPCKARIPRWGYNQKLGKCVTFFYGGCQANDNNFKTEEECNKACPSAM